ncbi:MAG: sulfurtransferase, partial [Acidimicrobiales bacterium]
MPVPHDPAPELQQYAHPERLVTTQWLADNLDNPDVVVVESDEDVLLYDTGHIPSAIKVDWHLDLNDPVVRDYVDGEGFSRLNSKNGIRRDSTVVFYGDNFNWWAAYALWVYSLFGHPDVRLLNGGRAKWIAEGRELTTDITKREGSDYPVVERDDAPIRAYRQDVEGHIGTGPLVDVRSPGEYSGELLHMPDYPNEGALRGGHIPTAKSKPWKMAANDDGTFKGADALRAIYEGELG